MPLSEVERHLEYIKSNNATVLKKNMTEERIGESLSMMRRSSEIKKVVSRHTRNLLREYVKEGRLTQSIPERDVDSLAIEMTVQERELYQKIKEFVNQWYSCAGEHKPTGVRICDDPLQTTSGIIALCLPEVPS